MPVRMAQATGSGHDQAATVADLTFRMLADCHEKERRLAEQLNITVSEFRCLRWFRGDQRLHIRELVERLGTSPSRMSRILADLEQKGFLVRAIEPQDRRNIIVGLTPKGIAYTAKLEERFVGIHREILEGIDPALHEQITKVLEAFLGSLKRWLKNP